MHKFVFILISIFLSFKIFAETKIFIAPTVSYLMDTDNTQAWLAGMEFTTRWSFLEIPIKGRGTIIENTTMLSAAGGIRIIFFDTIAISALGGYTKIGSEYRSPFYGTDISFLLPIGAETEFIPYVEYDFDIKTLRRIFLIGLKLNLSLYESKKKQDNNSPWQQD